MKSSSTKPLPDTIIDIWFAEIGDSSLEYEQQVEQFLSPQEQSRLDDRKHPCKRREFLLSRALIRYALSAKYDCGHGHWHFEEKLGQAPKITNLPEPGNLSLTHSGNLIACALSKHPVGIDLEQINNQRDFWSIAEISMSKEELAYLKLDTELDIQKFYRLWCCKEAIFKMLPPELQSKTSLPELSALHPQQNILQAFILQKQAGDFVISVASAVKIQGIKGHCLTMTPQSQLVTSLTDDTVWNE